MWYDNHFFGEIWKRRFFLCYKLSFPPLIQVDSSEQLILNWGWGRVNPPPPFFWAMNGSCCGGGKRRTRKYAENSLNAGHLWSCWTRRKRSQLWPCYDRAWLFWTHRFTVAGEKTCFRSLWWPLSEAKAVRRSPDIGSGAGMEPQGRDEVKGPVLHIVVVGFHHKKGCQVRETLSCVSTANN